VSESDRIRLGTRGSRLARWQADWVTEQLTCRGTSVQTVVIQTTGDVRAEPIGTLSSQGVFTKEIQRALLDHRIDLAVHSLKDLPTEPVDGLTLSAVPARAAEGDVLLSEASGSLAQLPSGARVGTGSLRRRAQLLYARPDLTLVPMRGNIETRLERLQLGEFDAIVLAQAGLERLALSSRFVEILDKRIMLPAVGQGALGLETRRDDLVTQRIVHRLNDTCTFQSVAAERALLARLRGGCMAPVGAWARFERDQLQLDAVVLHPEGTDRLHVSVHGEADRAVELGALAADRLLDQGAADLIAQSRHPENRRDS
jgi:hydroxymethylbilane synthase